MAQELTEFPAIYQLAGLDGKKGFSIYGENAGDNFGISVAGGDLNGDGIDDMAAGAYGSDIPANNAGRTYVLNGKEVSVDPFFLAAWINGINGFIVAGFEWGGNSGRSIAIIPDTNNDGRNDLLIGIPYADASPSNSGQACLVFPSNYPPPGIFSLAAIDGSNGHFYNGQYIDILKGLDVSYAGDPNGDGVGDFLLGSNPNSWDYGRANLVFGNRTFGPTMGLESADPQKGVIFKDTKNILSARRVCGIGDVTNDNFDDFLLGAPRMNADGLTDSGGAYLIRGRAVISSSGEFWPSGGSNLNGNNGMLFKGEKINERAGFGLGRLKDINADGVPDFAITATGAPNGANRGHIYFIWGNSIIVTSGLASASLADVVSTNSGIVVKGENDGDLAGYAVEGIGDFNADGYDDVAVSAHNADPNGANSGKVYIIFGGPWLNDITELPLKNITGKYGVELHGAAGGDETGYALSSGDFDNDGISDVLIGAHGSNVMGTNSGRVYVVFGDIVPTLTQSQMTLTEGQSFNVTDLNLNASSTHHAYETLEFRVNGISHGQFKKEFFPGFFIPANVFTQGEVLARQIIFEHDGSNSAPQVNISASSGRMAATIPQPMNINFTPINDYPIITAKTLVINQGETKLIDLSIIGATDEETPDDIQFTVDSVAGGAFQFVSQPGVPIFTFSKRNITEGQVIFEQDGTPTQPAFNVSATDANGATTGPEPALVIFTSPVITANALSINEGQTIVLTPANLAAMDSDDPIGSLIFTVSNIEHGRFEYNTAPGVPITTFTQQDIIDGKVRFVHDGGEFAPSYDVEVRDPGGLTDGPVGASISFDNNVNDGPVFVNTRLTVNEGQTVIITTSDIDAYDPDNTFAEIRYDVVDITGGYFTNNGIPATNFTKADVISGQVRFVHDGNEFPPSIALSATDGALSTPAVNATVTFSNVNNPPTMVNNVLSISEGQAVYITPANLAATDQDNSDDSLLISVSNVQGGYFYLKNDPNTPITAFTQQKINQLQVLFKHDGTNTPVNYAVYVNDGSSPVGPFFPTINYTPINDLPTVNVNQFNLDQGDAVTLTGQNLQVTDEETPADQLVITIVGIDHAKVVRTDNPAVAITSFGNKDLQEGKIRLVTDGGKLPPSVNFTISDTDGGIAGPIAAQINFNQRPDTVVNRLDINPGQTIGVTQANLKADDDDPDSIVTFFVKDIAHGYFSRVNDADKTPITEFTQQDVIDNNIQFTSDGSGFPSYKIIAGDGRLQDDPDAAIITYGGNRGQINAAENHTVRNALIGAGIAAVGALLVFGLKMYLKRRFESTLNQAILEADGESGKERAEYFNDVIQPIARAVFDEISIQRFLGFVSKKDMKRYINAIAYLVTQIKSRMVAGKPIKVDFRSATQIPESPQDIELESLALNEDASNILERLTQTDLISIIVRQTKEVLADELRKGCSASCKPQATPNMISDNAGTIADAIQNELQRLASRGRAESAWFEQHREPVVDWSGAEVRNPVFSQYPGNGDADATAAGNNRYSLAALWSTVNALKSRVFGDGASHYQPLEDVPPSNDLETGGGQSTNHAPNHPITTHALNANDSPVRGAIESVGF